MKKKYTKPVVSNLNRFTVTSGSCWTGMPEYTMVGPCTPGGQALVTCTTTGGIVLPRTDCDPSGSGAGKSCWNGNVAA